MIVSIDSMEITDGQAKCVIVLTGSIEALVNETKSETRWSFAERMSSEIARKVADEYFKLHKAELIERIDIDSIINGIKIKLIEGFSLQRNV
jgi:hypothetical protein